MSLRSRPGWLQQQGGVADSEMYRTFNMGMGYVFIVPEESVAGVQKVFSDARAVGRVTDTPGVFLRGEPIT